MSTLAHPPETLEGWYALHQVWSAPPDLAREAKARDRAATTLDEVSAGDEAGGGWSAGVRLMGSRADVMLVHFRATLDAIGDVQRRVQAEPLFRRLSPVYSFLSITEAGLYHLSAELAAAADARGGAVGDDVYRQAVKDRSAVERDKPHVRSRLFPPLPPEMPYVCFYPMSKRRDPDANWYALPISARSRLMEAHGMTGRRYAGRIVQIITGAIGLDAWEWGVTLFARDPLDFKKLVTDMRFDEVSAKYAAFGEFFVGRLLPPAELVASL